MQNGNIFNIVNNNTHGSRRSKSKSTDDMRIENAQNGGISLDSNTLKRMLKPMSSIDSPVTSPEMTRKRHTHHSYHYHPNNNNQKYSMSEAENENYSNPYRRSHNNKFQGSRSAHDMGRQYAGKNQRNFGMCHLSQLQIDIREQFSTSRVYVNMCLGNEGQILGILAVIFSILLKGPPPAEKPTSFLHLWI